MLEVGLDSFKLDIFAQQVGLQHYVMIQDIVGVFAC